MLHRVARFSYRHRRLVLLAWVVGLILAMVLSKAAGGKDANNFSLPGTESQQAIDMLKAHFPARSGDSADIVFSDSTSVAGLRAAIAAADAAAAKANPHISGVVGPFDSQAGHQISTDGRVAFSEVHLDVNSNKLPKGVGSAIQNAITTAYRAHAPPGSTINFAGGLFTARTPPGGTEIFGLAAAVIILIVAFGSLLAMAMPLFIAIFSILIGLAVLALLANVLEVFTFTTLIAAMIGIGVGIDYALFIVTRYRQGLHDGMSPADAVETAVSTAGRAVLFAGTTVCIAVMGMFLMGLSFVSGLALGSAAAVLTTMAASVTLLPAMLGFIGRNIDRLSLPFLHASAATASTRGGFWFNWSRRIQRRPWPFAVGAFVLLVTLALPVTGLHLGFPDAGTDPKGTTTRSAYDTLAAGFGKGYNGPLTVAASLPSPASIAVLDRLEVAFKADPGVASVGPIVTNSKTDPTAAIITVTPKTSPQDAATATWVRHIRRDVIPPVIAGTGVVAKTTGEAAFNIDITHLMSSRLPWFFGAVIALSFLLLMVVFRSVLVPLKAAVMNLLSIGAAFGILVAVFQWGWGAAIIGVSKQPIVSFSPMMLFAILFGLSMDYEVFLLSRVKEEHDRTGDNALAVADGLAATARVITAAAAIMVCVFFTFLFQTDQVAKLFGLGLGLSILIDATVVRMVLVPATMELLGEANWWLPGWLARILPRVNVDGSHVEPPVREPALV